MDSMNRPIVWVGKQEGFEDLEPFNGLQIVFNIAAPKYRGGEEFPGDYQEQVSEALAFAHASGSLVAHVFDDMVGVVPHPDWMEVMEEDMHVFLHDLVPKKGEASFSVLPDVRRRELAEIAHVILSHRNLRFTMNRAKAIGACKIGGVDVLLPQTAVVE